MKLHPMISIPMYGLNCFLMGLATGKQWPIVFGISVAMGIVFGISIGNYLYGEYYRK